MRKRSCGWAVKSRWNRLPGRRLLFVSLSRRLSVDVDAAKREMGKAVTTLGVLLQFLPQGAILFSWDVVPMFPSIELDLALDAFFFLFYCNFGSSDHRRAETELPAATTSQLFQGTGRRGDVGVSFAEHFNEWCPKHPDKFWNRAVRNF